MMYDNIKEVKHMEKVFTLEEIAEYLKVHPNTVRNLIKAGKLKAFKAGRELRFTESALTEFINGETVEPSSVVDCE